jgi:hypothetical protein
MKKVLIVSQYFYPENFRINDIAVQLVKRGFDVTILTGLPNYPLGKYYPGYNNFKTKKDVDFQGVKIIRLPILPRGKTKISLALNYLSFWVLGSLFSVFTRRRFDLVFTYGISPILQGSIANTYAKRFKVKSYLYLMDFWPYSIEAVDGIKNKSILKLLGHISKSIYYKSDKILISSKGYQGDLIELGVDQSKISYWPQYHEEFYKPVPVNFSLTPELNPDRFNFTFTGNIGHAQGLDDFLVFAKEYYSKLIKLNCHFNFIGDGRGKKELMDFVSLNKLNQLVTFIHTVPADKIPNYLANSKVALLIIKDNPFMNKVLPAKVPTYVGCKVPILAVCSAPLAIFIENNEFGISTHSYDKNQIMVQIQKIINSHEEIRKKSMKAIDQFKQDHLINELINHIS